MMSRAQESSLAKTRKPSTTNVWREGLYLARREVKRSLPSYFLTGAVTLLFSAGFVTPVVYQISTGEAFSNFLADLVFLAIFGNLALNWASTSYLSVGDDPFLRRLGFLRSLPIPAGAIVASRAITLLATLLITSAILLLPAYLLFAPVRAEMAFGEYLSFALVWCAYGLLFGVASAYLEWSIRGKTLLSLQFASIFTLILAAFLAQALDASLVAGSVEIARSQTLVVAAVAIFACASALSVFVKATEKRIERRDLS